MVGVVGVVGAGTGGRPPANPTCALIGDSADGPDVGSTTMLRPPLVDRDAPGGPLALPHDASPRATPTGNSYDKYNVGHPIERRLVTGFLAALDSAIDTAVPGAAPARVLEVGAGEGEISARVRSRFPEATVVSIDLHDPSLGDEWRRRGALGTFADVRHLPFPDDAFDLVLGIEVLEHVPEPGLALAEIGRVGGGAIVLSVPREPVWRVANVVRGRYLGQLGNTPGHLNHWSTRGFRSLVAEHFEVQTTRRPFPWTILSARRRPPS